MNYCNPTATHAVKPMWPGIYTSNCDAHKTMISVLDTKILEATENDKDRDWSIINRGIASSISTAKVKITSHLSSIVPAVKAHHLHLQNVMWNTTGSLAFLSWTCYNLLVTHCFSSPSGTVLREQSTATGP